MDNIVVPCFFDSQCTCAYAIDSNVKPDVLLWVTEHLSDVTWFHQVTVTGSLSILARSFRSSLCNVYSAVINCSRITTRNYSCLFFASRHWFHGTVNFASETLTHPQPVHNLEYSQRFLSKFSRGERAFSSDSSSDEDMDPYFEGSYAKLGTSSCKKCKEKIEKGALRLAKVRYANKSDSSVSILSTVLLAHSLWTWN